MDSNGVYNYIDSIPSESLFKLVFGSLIFFISLSKFLPTVFNNIFALVIVSFFFVFFRDKEVSEISDLNTEIYKRYLEIQDIFKRTNKTRPTKLNETELNQIPLFLQYDPDIINLFWNILDFAELHPFAYQSTISSADHFLRIYSDLLKAPTSNCSENKELADHYASETMNHYHSMIFKIPSNRILNDKFERNKKKLHLLLRRKQDEMHDICKKQRKSEPITYRTKFDENTGPKSVFSGTSFDTDPFDFYYL